MLTSPTQNADPSNVAHFQHHGATSVFDVLDRKIFISGLFYIHVISVMSKISWLPLNVSGRPQNGAHRDCRHVLLWSWLHALEPRPACACPEEAKLGTFDTDRGKDWGAVAKKSISHTHMSRPP